MKRTSFLTLGLIVISLVACTDKKKEETPEVLNSNKEQVRVEVEQPKEIAETVAFEDCEKIAELALEAEKLETEAVEEIDYAEEVAEVVEEAPRKALTKEELAVKAKEAELWFQTNYAKLIDDNVSNYEGVRVSIATDGTVTGVSLLNNGNWSENVKLLELLKTVLVTNHLELGKAISITVKNA